MQEVYLARDTLLNIDVAIKTPQIGQKPGRFTKSAVLAARINHHNVAKTYDYFALEDKQFLIEEFVHGETLEQKLKRFKFVDPHLGARIFTYLAKGIAASHHVGVIHRDLKPSNIMVDSGVNLQELKITDFGIATLTEEIFEAIAKDGEMTNSASGTIKGAIPFMAPEVMFWKEGDKITSKADIWSLGAMMFRILTGEYPFGVLFEAAGNLKMKMKHSWPQFTILHSQFSFLSKELQLIVDKCLDYSPDKRPSADDIIKECLELCYINVEREEASVLRFIQNGYSGFARDKHGETFFSMESLYGRNKADVQVGTKICYSLFPGNPQPRGHPIMIFE
jgi:serine/threonine-protein kinase